jgi:hypothetical protein
MASLYLSESALKEGLQDIRKAVEGLGASSKKEMATAMAVFFSVARAMKTAGKKRLQVSAKITPNHRNEITEAYCDLFCDSAKGTLSMVMPGEIGDINEGNRERKNNKARLHSNVFTTRWKLSENETLAYPAGTRDPVLLELKSSKVSDRVSCEVYFHKNWKKNLQKYLSGEKAWQGVVLFMLRNQPFDLGRSAISGGELIKKLRALFPADVATKLSALAKL